MIFSNLSVSESVQYQRDMDTDNMYERLLLLHLRAVSHVGPQYMWHETATISAALNSPKDKLQMCYPHIWSLKYNTKL